VIAQAGESTSPQNTRRRDRVVNKNNPLKIVIRKFTTRQASVFEDRRQAAGAVRQ